MVRHVEAIGAVLQRKSAKLNEDVYLFGDTHQKESMSLKHIAILSFVSGV
jgi:hypothetical protein